MTEMPSAVRGPYKFEANPQFEAPEAQIRSDNVLVEIGSFQPNDRGFRYVASHHVLASWLSPIPVIGKALLDPDTDRLSDIGGVSFIPAGRSTRWHYPPDSGEIRVVLIHIAPDVFNVLETGLGNRIDTRRMVSANIRDPGIRRTLRLLVDEALAPGLGSRILIDSVTNLLLVQIARYFESSGFAHASGKGGLAPWQMRRVTEVATKNSVVGPAELAGLVGISEGHLRRAFKKSTGFTLGEYLRKVRLERAKALLSGGEDAIADIALRSGFSTQYGFTDAFRRYTGETPSAFRKRMRFPGTPSAVTSATKAAIRT